MSESIQLQPFTLETLPPMARRHFERAITEAHGLVQRERESFEDPGGDGPQLQAKGGNLRCTVTLTVHIDVAVETGGASIVAQVSTSLPKRKAVKSAVLMRRSGFLVEEDEEQDRLPLSRTKPTLTVAKES